MDDKDFVVSAFTNFRYLPLKVIDPDDLPQRARWTIIATACLLLVMCLALVGATLRMAPLIDDMGKWFSEFLFLGTSSRSGIIQGFSRSNPEPFTFLSK